MHLPVPLQELADTLPASSGSRLLSHLNALKRLAKYNHEAFAAKENVLFSVLLSQLSGKKSVNQRKAEAEEVSGSISMAMSLSC